MRRCVVAGVLAALAALPSAGAATEPLDASGLIGGPRGVSTGGLFTEPSDVAVYWGGAGRGRKLYVVEGGGGNHRVQRLDANGNFELAWGRDVVRDGAPGDTGNGFEVCRAAVSGAENCQAAPAGAAAGELRMATAVAVSEQSGDVYVLDHGNHRVQRFDSGGRFLGAWGRGVATGGLQFEVCTSGCRAGRSDPRERHYETGFLFDPKIGAIAVDPRPPHHVFAGDERVNTIFEFTPDGEFVRGWGLGVATGGSRFEICSPATECRPGRRRFGGAWPRHLAIDEAGIVYGSESGRSSGVTRFAPGSPPDPPNASRLLRRPLTVENGLSVGFVTGLAFDSETGRLMLARNGFGPAVVDEVSDPDAPFGQHGTRPRSRTHDSLPYLDSVTGLDAADGNLYLAKSSKLYPDDPVTSQDGCRHRQRTTPCNGVLLFSPAGQPSAVALTSEVTSSGLVVRSAVAARGAVRHRIQVSDDGWTWRRRLRPRNAVTGSYAGLSADPVRLAPERAYRARVLAERLPDGSPVYSNSIVVIADANGADRSDVPALVGGASFPGRVLVRAVDDRLPDADGALYEVSADRGARRVGKVRCARVHARAGRGLCLRVAPNGFDYEALALGPGYRTTDDRHRVEGVPSRARVSSDGRYGAFTNFAAAGQGYFADTSRFSAFTRIVDLHNGELVLRLEDLDVRRDGKRVPLEDAEFWGVTFAAGGRYYATLAPGQEKVEHLLIEGSIGSERARVVADHVECPSLSPDLTRIAYKRRIGESNRWRLHVRDLATGRDTALAETRSIDDQPEWVGDELVAFSDGRSVYTVPADGSGAAEKIIDRATSPAWLGR